MVKGEQSPGQLDGEACCPGFVKRLIVMMDCKWIRRILC